MALPAGTHCCGTLADRMDAGENAPYGQEELEPESEPEPAGIIREADDPCGAAEAYFRGDQ